MRALSSLCVYCEESTLLFAPGEDDFTSELENSLLTQANLKSLDSLATRKICHYYSFVLSFIARHFDVLTRASPVKKETTVKHKFTLSTV